MTWRTRLTEWLKPTRSTPFTPGHPALREAVDAGRRAKFNENYPLARESLDRAYEIALRDRVESAAMTVVVLQRAEVLARIGDFEAADTMIVARLTAPEHDAQRAFLMCAGAMVAAIKGEDGVARAQAEKALDLAKALKLPGAEGRAAGVLAEVYLREGNASYAARLLRDALPKVNTTGEIELSSAFVGMLGEALIENGQAAEGVHLIERALTLAEQIGYRMYERRWKIALGTRALNEGRYEDARNFLQRAIPQFKPDAPTRQYVDALVKLARACVGEREYTDALGYAQIAVRAAETVGAPEQMAAARGVRGNALRSLGQVTDAIPDLQAAVSPNGTASSESLRTLAAALVEGGDIKGAEATYQRALESAEQADIPLEIAGVKRDLGLLYMKQGQTNAAIQEWMAALTIYETQKATAHAARLYCDIGSARKALGHGARALKDFEQALTLLNAVDPADTETRGRVLSNAANAYAEHGDAESADAFFNEAIKLAEQSGDRVAESIRSGNYGWFLLQVGRPRRAISLLGRALQLSQTLNMPLQHAVQTDNMGLAYQSLDDDQTALEYHSRALAEVEPLDNLHWATTFRINQATALIGLDQRLTARSLIDQSLTAARTMDNPELMIRAQIAAARLALVENQPETALSALDEAAAKARRADFRRLLAETLELRSRLLAMQGDVTDAASAWEEAAKLYNMLHMPQGKNEPDWLTGQPSA